MIVPHTRSTQLFTARRQNIRPRNFLTSSTSEDTARLLLVQNVPITSCKNLHSVLRAALEFPALCTISMGRTMRPRRSSLNTIPDVLIIVFLPARTCYSVSIPWFGISFLSSFKQTPHCHPPQTPRAQCAVGCRSCPAQSTLSGPQMVSLYSVGDSP